MKMDKFDDLKPQNAPAKLDHWNIADLENYIERLESEITNVRQVIAQKKSVSKAAEALFSSSSQS